MPQLFQVLRCYKCLIFQIHQTKKSNKYQCKICGEKQSIKRHYGLGNGKECRLHVQRLNALRGETEEEMFIYEDAGGEFECKENKNGYSVEKTGETTKSKWSTYINCDNVQEKDDLKYLKYKGVCSNNPRKKRKVNDPEQKHSWLLPEATVDKNNIGTSQKFKSIYETNPETKTAHEECKHKTDNESPTKIKVSFLNMQNSVQHPVQVQSKWSQFVEHEEKLEPNVASAENSTLYNGQKLFELCDDTDLDGILNISF